MTKSHLLIGLCLLLIVPAPLVFTITESYFYFSLEARHAIASVAILSWTCGVFIFFHLVHKE
jgi:hypothetical protein